MGKLIILRGNSGGGKSAIAKELQSRFGQNTMIILQDEIRRNMLNVKRYTCVTSYERTSAIWE